MFWWKPGTQDNPNGNDRIVDGHVADQRLVLFCLRVDTSRVYRCESLSYADDGLVEVANYAPRQAAREYLQWDESTFDIQVMTAFPNVKPSRRSYTPGRFSYTQFGRRTGSFLLRYGAPAYQR